MERYLIYAVLGLLSGLVFYIIAVHHVKVRSEYDNGDKLAMLKNKKAILIWLFAAEFIFMIVCRMGLSQWDTIRVLIFAMLAFNVSVVDILIRRIPNTILLGMLGLQIANMTYLVLVEDADPAKIIPKAIGGLFLAYFVFSIPGLLGMSVGGGDIKYSATLGFMLDFRNYMEAMAVMALATILYYIYLKITKTGTIKTKAPMAPFLSIGAIVAVVAPLF